MMMLRDSFSNAATSLKGTVAARSKIVYIQNLLKKIRSKVRKKQEIISFFPSLPRVGRPGYSDW